MNTTSLDCRDTLQIDAMSTPLSAEEENFLRLTRIILHDLPSQLRSLFINEFARKYGWPYGNDAASGAFFLGNILPQNRCRDATVRNNIQHGDTTLFDCTTLFYCILYSGALLQPPLRPRNVRSSPLNSSELLDQLREHRNMLAHSPGTEISPADFSTRVNDLQAIYQQLGWSCTDLLQAATGPLTTAECSRLQQALLSERAHNNALDQIVQSHDLRLLAVEGMLPHMWYYKPIHSFVSI